MAHLCEQIALQFYPHLSKEEKSTEMKTLWTHIRKIWIKTNQNVMTFNQFRVLWQSKSLHSDVIGKKKMIYLKTFSAKKKKINRNQS